MKTGAIQTEHTITINHHPIHFHAVLIIVVILWDILCLILMTKIIFKIVRIIILIIMILGMLLITMLFSNLDKHSTVVVYNKNELKLLSYSKETIINLSEITCISYGFFEENNGYRDRVMRLELTITKGNRDIFINDRIDRNQVKGCISGKNKRKIKTIPLMQLYSFIAEIYPDKVIGYKE